MYLNINLMADEVAELEDIASEADDDRFNTATQMITLRLKQEVRERRIARDTAAARKKAEERY